MATNTYRAQLNYHDSRWGWGNEGAASQGAWDGTGTRTGVLYFPGLASLKTKIINSVKITVTTGQTGWGLATTKTVNFYRSASQGGIKTSLGASHRTGDALGSVQGAMYDNTVTYTAAFLATRIAAGDDTYCIYNGSSSTDYLKWTSVSLEVAWSEPATQPSLNQSTVEMGAAVTISTSATNSGYRHTLRYAFGGASGTIATGVASAHTWTPPVSLAAQIPNAASGSGTIYCDTYSGGTLLGTKSVSITLTVPASVKPTAGTLSASVADDTSGTGLYVKGMGKARLTFSGAAGAQGSTIRTTVISGGGWSASGSTLLTGVLQAAGSMIFTATVTDSRGRTASTTATISVIDYAKPGISSCTVYRCNSAGTKQNDGTYAAVEISAFYSAISGNTLSLGVAYKKSSESSYGGGTGLTNGGKTVIGGGALSASTTYDVRVTVSDRYNTVEQVYSLPTKSVLLSFFKNFGAAIGKVSELPGWLDIGWPTRVRQNLQVDGSIEEKRRRTTYSLNTPGWYKICTFQASPLGKNYLLSLSRNYNYTNNEVYLINAACAYHTGTIHLAGKQVNATGFSQAALYLDSSNAMSLYAYYALSAMNDCQVDMLANSADFTLSLEPMSPTGTLLSELNLSDPAVSSRNTICQWRMRYHSDDGISEDDAITEYSFVYGGNTALGLSGPMLSIGTLGPTETDGRGRYRMQLAGDYSNGTVFRIRTYDGDNDEWNPWRSIYTSANKIPASKVADLNRVDLWQGTCNKGGSVTVTNAFRYSVLWLCVTPGSGETEMIACEYNNRVAVRQIASNNAYITITSSISGNDKTFTVSGGYDGCKLTKIVGAVQFQ